MFVFACFCFFLLWGLVCLFRLLFLSLVNTPIWTCWTVYWSMLSFDSPMREHTRHCTIRSNGTNTVLRPGESREGEGRKKKAPHCVLSILVISKFEGVGRVEAHVNSVEQLVIQRQLSLVQTLGNCRPRTFDIQDVPRSNSGVTVSNQNYLEHPVHRSSSACEPGK